MLGAKGNCLDIVEAMVAHNQAAGREVWRPLGFLDDDPALAGTRPLGLPVLGGLEQVTQLAEVQFVLGVGSPLRYPLRPQLLERWKLPDERFATVLHPAAAVSPSARIGPGSVVLSHSSIGAQAELEAHVFVLQNCVISHDARVRAHSILASGAILSGSVEVGPCAYIGAQASLRQGVRVGQGALIGMGSVVVKDVAAHQRAWGNPAVTREATR